MRNMSYNSDGQLAAVKSQRINQSPRTYANSFLYTTFGTIAHVRLGNGKWETTQFNNRLQATQIGLGTSANDTSLLKLNYDYGTTDNNGNVKSQTITVPGMVNPLVQTYTYDFLSRLTHAKETSNGTVQWQQTFDYDRFGNRTLVADQSATTPEIVGPNPQISEIHNRIVPRQGEQYDYDNNGNLIKDKDGNTFIYNAENKLVQYKQVESEQPTATYVYDGNGLRVKKISNSETTVFVYDAKAKLVAEYSTTLPPEVPEIRYLTTDTLGSPRIITNASGQVKERHDYLPFGDEIYSFGGRTINLNYSEDKVRQKFTGYEKDTESGLDFAQARYYSNLMGRFTTPDIPFADQFVVNPQSWNLYTYVLNNPFKYVDPSGLGHTTNDGHWVGDYDGEYDSNINASWNEKGQFWDFVGGYGVLTVSPYNFFPTVGDLVINYDRYMALWDKQSAPERLLKKMEQMVKQRKMEKALVEAADYFYLGAMIFFEAFTISRMPIDDGIPGGVSKSLANEAEVLTTFRASTTELKAAQALAAEARVAEQALNNCFIAGTLILTEKGYIAIENIKIGDNVLSWNENTHQLEYKPVTRTFVNIVQTLIAITIEGEKPIVTTFGHPFFIRSTGDNTLNGNDQGNWVLAKSLRVGDRLLTANGGWMRIDKIEVRTGPDIVYNFEVDDNHNYFVSQHRILVHNESIKLLSGLTSNPLSVEEKTGWRMISGKVTNILNGALSRDVLTESEKILAARKYLSEAFNPKGSYPKEGVTAFQLERANYILNGGTAPGPMITWLRVNGYIK